MVIETVTQDQKNIISTSRLTLVLSVEQKAVKVDVLDTHSVFVRAIYMSLPETEELIKSLQACIENPDAYRRACITLR